MEWIYLILVAVVLIFGLGVLLLNRRSARRPDRQPAPPAPRPDRPPKPADRGSAAGTAVLDRDADALEAPPEVPVQPEPLDEPEVLEQPTFRGRMSKARSALAAAFGSVRGRAGVTAETWDDLEEALLRADVGVAITDELLGGLKARVKAKEITSPDQLLAALRAEMTERLDGTDRSLRFDDSPGGPNVWLFVGVNGVGKTTTIGKVAKQQHDGGRSVLLAAGDTFRAAAAEQLHTWAERSGAAFVRGAEGGDPSSVIFDAVDSATAKGIDLVLGDTAGRLHTKTNLMDELGKVRRVASKGAGRVTEVLLVIDATTGQNGLTQTREFSKATKVAGDDASGITGVVLTKLDGSAKGGVVFAIETELGVPIKLVGLGETIVDLVPFNPTDFVDALFD